MLTTSFRRVLGVIVLATILASPVRAVERNWPQFRGPTGSGVLDKQHPPIEWNAGEGTTIKWKTRIPGLAHASPIVWADRVYITSAVSSDPDPYFRPGLYGESPDHPEQLVHEFRLYCLDKNTGRIIWDKTACQGIPQIKRHIKSTHANPTPATDGKHVVAFFGSEGLYCYDLEGKRLWKQDLGRLDAGAFNAPEIQWAFGSSPIIHDGKVIVQCDVNNQSFIAAFDVATGKEIWRTLRDETPTWSTPTVHIAPRRSQVIANGFKHIGGYDLNTGEELWRMRGGGDIPVPTPVVAHNLIFITNAHGRLAPIYAIRINAEGDITLEGDKTSNKSVAWSRPKRGAYIPTPIVYGKYLYVGDDRGILTCYKAKSGTQIYRKRLSQGAFSASPVAADGKIYFTGEDGDIHVVKAGRKFEVLASNPMGEACLATPAISDGMLFVRTSKHLYGIGK
jgi:outer membrane protein assembly factor BamB